MQKHHHTPLVKDIWLYYNLASVQVVGHYIINLIPFDGKHAFDLFSITPFPIIVNGTRIIWDGAETNLLINGRDAEIIELGKDLESKCIEAMGQFYCKALHAEQPLRALPFLRVLIEGSVWKNNTCNFVEYNNSFTFQHVPPHIILFSNVSVRLTIICDGKTRQTILHNVQAVASGCEIRIPDTFTYVPSKLLEYAFLGSG